jgi:hypothetical protein
MKQFGIIFGAVLAAIFAAIFILYVWFQIDSWENSKTNGIRNLSERTEELAKANSYLSGSPSDELIRDAHLAIDGAEEAVAADQLSLIHTYDRKWLPLSSEESEQYDQCTRGVAEYRAKHPDKDLGPKN